MVGEACRSLVVCPAFPLPLARVGMPAIGRPSGGVDCDIQASQRRGNAYIGGGKRGGGLWCPFPPPWNHRRRGSWGVGQQQWCAAAFGWPAACIYRTYRSRVPSRQDSPPPTGSVNVGVARACLSHGLLLLLLPSTTNGTTRGGQRGGWGGSTRCGSGVTRVHACECWHLKGGLGGRRKVGGRGGRRESVVLTAPHGPRGTRREALPQRSRGVAAGVYPAPPTPHYERK